MDPRVTISAAALDEQLTTSARLADAAERIAARLGGATAGRREPASPAAGDPAAAKMRQVHRRLLQVYEALQGADVEPTAAVRRAAAEALAEADAVR
jgi:hypothetical protein